MHVHKFHHALFVAAGLIALVLVGCKRSSEGSESVEAAKTTVSDNAKAVAKATEKAAKDIGQATVDLADKAAKGIEDVKNNVGTDSQDAWITTKVKGELSGDGFDPLHVHVDTSDRIVTLSGTVDSAEKAKKAVSLAQAVKGVASVKDHLFVTSSGAR